MGTPPPSLTPIPANFQVVPTRPGTPVGGGRYRAMAPAWSTLLDCEYDERLRAVRFSALYEGVFGRGLMPIRRLAILTGKVLGPELYLTEFRQAIADGFINLTAYRIKLGPWDRRAGGAKSVHPDKTAKGLSRYANLSARWATLIRRSAERLRD